MSITKKLQMLYERGGASAVYDYAIKHKKSFMAFWEWCWPCMAETPTAKNTMICACCGQGRSK